MDAGVGVDEVGDLTDLEGVGGLLKSSLHLAGTEETQIASLGSRAALAVLLGQVLEVLNGLDLASELADVGDGLVFGTSHLFVAQSVEGVSRANVFLEEVEHADLTLVCHLALLQFELQSN